MFSKPFKNIFYLFIWPRWVLVVAHGIFVAACRIFSLQYAGFSLVVVRAPGYTGSVVAACGLSSRGAQALQSTGSVVAA